MPLSKQEFSSLVNRNKWLPLRRATRFDVNYILPYGFGLVFPRCYANNRTWLHDHKSHCPNCDREASQGAASLHYCCLSERQDPLALFLPGAPTSRLLNMELLSLDEEYPALTVRKLDRPSIAVEVEAAARTRRRPLDSDEDSRAKLMLSGTALQFFLGKIDPARSTELFLPWNMAKDLLCSE
jgi:hypothetical protein